jgi:hypothetical protein
VEPRCVCPFDGLSTVSTCIINTYFGGCSELICQSGGGAEWNKLFNRGRPARFQLVRARDIVCLRGLASRAFIYRWSSCGCPH